MTVRNAYSSKIVKKNRKSRKKRSNLMNAACAGLLGAGMMAAPATQANADLVFNESTIGDFSDDFANRDSLPDGTCQVFGMVDDPGGGGDSSDFFQFEGLDPSSQVRIFGSVTGEDFDGVSLSFTDSDENLLGSFYDPNDGSFDDVLTVPTDGVLVANWFVAGESGEGSYNFNLTSVPEPNVAGLLGLGAAGLLGRRRRKSNS